MTDSPRGRGRSYYKKSVKNNFEFWKPIIFGILTFTEASEGDPEMLFEACAAADLKIEFENKKYNKMFGGKK